MKNLQRFGQELRSDESGIAATEMGLILVPFSVLLMGAFDLGYQNYLRSVMQGTLTEAARRASTENPAFDNDPNAPGETIEEKITKTIKRKMKDIAPHTTPTISLKNYYEFSGVGKPEKLTSDNNGNGQFDEDDGDCWEDVNDNDTYDVSAGRSGLGGASDIVFYEVNVDMPRIFPMAGLIGVSDHYNITAKTAFRTQPFDVQIAPVIVCAET